MSSENDLAEAFARGVHSSRKFVEAVELRQWERKASERGLSYPGGGVLDLYDAAFEILTELSKGMVVQRYRDTACKFIEKDTGA